MLELFLCTDRKKNTALAILEICRRAAKGQAGQILVTPEQFSHAAERELCQRGGDTISRFAEVLSFSRLASRVFSVEGGAADTETDAGGRLLMMSRAVEQVQSRLKLFGTGAEKPEFLLRLIDTLEEFRSFCITPQELRRAEHELSGILAVKMEEFALLMQSYESVCANCGQNPETRLNRLLAALETGDFSDGKTFYFDGFTDFNGIQREILSQLLANDVEVRVFLTCEALDGTAQQYEAVRDTARQLLAAAQMQGTTAAVHLIPEEGPETPLRLLRETLFSGGKKQYEAPQDAVSLRLAPDVRGECRWAVGEILRLIGDGARWRDIAVAYTDESVYRPVLETLLRGADIPAYFAGDRSLLLEPVVHFLLSSLEAATGGMEQEPVLSYLKSDFSPIPQERMDRMENYIFLWNLSAGRWERPWTMNPYGFARPLDADGEALLAQLEEDRQTAFAPLLALRDALRRAGNTGEMILALNAFLETIAFRERLNAQAAELYASGELQRAQEYAQIYGTICTLLEQTYGVLGKTVRAPEDFFAVFRTALSQYHIGSIPATLDCVTLGALPAQRRCDAEYLLVLGANEGSFPATQENQSLLTDHERASLMRIGVGVSPTASGRLDRELAGIHDVLSAPRRRIYLTATDGKEAYYFRRAADLFPGSLRPASDQELLTRSAREYRTYLSAHLRDFEAKLPENVPPQAIEPLLRAKEYHIGNLTPPTVRMLYGKTLRLSSTKIDCLAGCRFSYFLQYGIRARERKPAQLDAQLYGTFVHYVLEHTVRQTQQEGGFAAVPPERVLAIAEETMQRYADQELANLFESEREAYLFRRTFSEVRQVVQELYVELSKSAFVPRWFELEFSARGPLPAVRIAGREMTAELEGFVDRADTWENGDTLYVRIVDYKTGKKEFDYTNILNGLGLQMLLYLFTLEREGKALTGRKLVPAGVLYFPARMERVSVKDRFSDAEADAQRRKALRRKGLLLDNENVLQAMEPCDEEPVFLPYSYDKNGERTGDLASRAQLRILEKYVFSTVAALADELAQGNITANPYYCDDLQNACRWCPYRELCADGAEKRWLEKIPGPQQFWEILEKEDAHG